MAANIPLDLLRAESTASNIQRTESPLTILAEGHTKIPRK